MYNVVKSVRMDSTLLLLHKNYGIGFLAMAFRLTGEIISYTVSGNGAELVVQLN